MKSITCDWQQVPRRDLFCHALTATTATRIFRAREIGFRPIRKTAVGNQGRASFRDQKMSSTGHFAANPATNYFFKKNERGIRPKCKKQRKHEHTTVLKKRTIWVFKCWLNCQSASFEALLSFFKKINDPCRFHCLPASVQKRCPSKWSNFFVFSNNLGQTCPVKEFWWSRNGATSGT